MAAEHVKGLIVEAAGLVPDSVGAVEFGASDTGKCNVVFSSAEHCSLAFNALPGEAKPDTGGFDQKKVTIHTAQAGAKSKMLISRFWRW